jgi:uncharacterized protein YwqG
VKTDVRSNSYLGGSPPDYDGFTWPKKEGRPLSFIACIDLSEVADRSDIRWLPKGGHLLFFYDVEEQPWGFDPKDSNGWKVNYVSDSVSFIGESSPPDGLSSDYRLPRKYVAFQKISLPPSWDHPDVASLELDDSEIDKYVEFRSELFGQEPHHQMAGYADPIQGAEMELECQLVSNGLYCGDSSGYEAPRAKELAEGASDWRLLLQVDSDEELDAMWGDGGMLYFWVRQQDAQNGNFERSWLVLQCY